MNDRQLLKDLRLLGAVNAPGSLLGSVLNELRTADQYASLDTALGPVFVAWNGRGVSAVMKTSTGQEFEERFRERFGRTPHQADEVPASVGQTFDLRYLTEFERAVLLKAGEIPRGEIRTYGWIADQIGRPQAVRAVGTALRKNPVPVLIPCHRVVRSDGRIGDYALGGSEAKRRILAAEGITDDQIPVLARQWQTARGVRVTALG